MGFALPILGGLAIGAAGTGMAAMQANRQRQQMQAQQQQAAMQAQMQNQMMAQQAMAQQQAQQQQMQLAMEQDRQQTELLSMQKKQSVGPSLGTDAKNLGTILTSPLGDPTDANVGRRKLLSAPPRPQGA